VHNKKQKINIMKILFIGTVDFSLRILSKLIDLNENIIGVITKSKSDFNSDFVDLSILCKKHSIPFLYSDNINNIKTESWIRELEPDIGFCFGWSQIIKEKILNIPKQGIIGFHPANLPQNRGRHPIIWALVLGLEDTASTFFFMDKGADSGKIISQNKISISYNDDALSLYEKITNIASEQISIIITELKHNSIKLIEQDNKKANTWRKRGVSDGQIDFRMCSNAIYNLVRALTHPYVASHILYKGKEIKIWKVVEIPFNTSNIEPGYVIEITEEKHIVVKTYDGAIKLIEHEFIDLPLKNQYL
jgi:methionyl-tRNA formyltransferase